MTSTYVGHGEAEDGENANAFWKIQSTPTFHPFEKGLSDSKIKTYSELCTWAEWPPVSAVLITTLGTPSR